MALCAGTPRQVPNAGSVISPRIEVDLGDGHARQHYHALYPCMFFILTHTNRSTTRGHRTPPPCQRHQSQALYPRKPPRRSLINLGAEVAAGTGHGRQLHGFPHAEMGNEPRPMLPRGMQHHRQNALTRALLNGSPLSRMVAVTDTSGIVEPWFERGQNLVRHGVLSIIPIGGRQGACQI